MAQRRNGGSRYSPSGDRRLAEEFELALSGAAAGGARNRASGYGGARPSEPRERSSDGSSYDGTPGNGALNGARHDGPLNGAGYGGSARRQPSSPATPNAAHVNALVTVARRVEDAGTALPGMDEAFRARLRERLVRLTPELASPAAKPAVPSQRGGRHAGLRKPVTPRQPHTTGISAAWRRRLLAAGVGVAVATGSVGGIAIASAGAVPGDPLYSAKKMFENIQLSLSGSPTDRGGQYLKLADTRLSEIDALLSHRDADVPGSPTAAYLDQALTDLQTMIGDGGDLLIGEARANGDEQAVHLLSDFLLTERQRVADLTWQLPLSLQNRPAQIVSLMDDLYRRLQQAAAAMPKRGGPAPTPSVGPQPGDVNGPGPGTGQADSSSAAASRSGGAAQRGASHGVSPSEVPSAGASGTSGASPSASASGSASATPTIGVHLPLPILPSIGVNLPPLLPGLLPGIDLGLGGSGTNSGSDPSATPQG
jgi:uncharacterized protein DUF5667